MCVSSMIGDHYRDKWKPYEPVFPNTGTISFWPVPQITKEEFEALKREVLEMKELLKKAIKYDKENNQPDCETTEKFELIKKIAEFVGVDLKELQLNI